jgi:hypothetical protein
LVSTPPPLLSAAEQARLDREFEQSLQRDLEEIFERFPLPPGAPPRPGWNAPKEQWDAWRKKIVH